MKMAIICHGKLVSPNQGLGLYYAGRRRIDALRVECSSVERGCGWVGTVGTLKERGFALIPCPKECKGEDTKVIRQLMRKDVKIHLKNDCPNREDECEYCGMKGTYQNIKEVHEEDSPMF